jgi:hypothetical protein
MKKFYLGPNFGTLINRKWITNSWVVTHSIQVGVAGIKRGTTSDLIPHTANRDRFEVAISRWQISRFGSDLWTRRSNGKVLVDHPLRACQVKRVSYGVKSRSARVGKVIHPCRVKSFQKAMSTVMDDSGTDSMIIENLNLIVKLGNMWIRMPPPGYRGGDPRWVVWLILIWWISRCSVELVSSLYYPL